MKGDRWWREDAVAERGGSSGHNWSCCGGNGSIPAIPAVRNLYGLICSAFWAIFSQITTRQRLNENRNESWYFFSSLSLWATTWFLQHFPHICQAQVSLFRVYKSCMTHGPPLTTHWFGTCCSDACSLQALWHAATDTHLLWQSIAVLFLWRQENPGLNKDCITKTLRPVKLLPSHSLWTRGSTFSWSSPRVMIRVGEGWDWVAGCPCLLWN